MGKKIDWVKNLEQLSKSKEKMPVGEGWFTIKEFIENSGIGTHRAYDIVRAALKEKKVEKFSGSEYCQEHQHRVKRCWYRFIDPK